MAGMRVDARLAERRRRVYATKIGRPRVSIVGGGSGGTRRCCRPRRCDDAVRKARGGGGKVRCGRCVGRARAQR
jgi:hypothetical protein